MFYSLNQYIGNKFSKFYVTIIIRVLINYLGSTIVEYVSHILKLIVFNYHPYLDTLSMIRNMIT